MIITIRNLTKLSFNAYNNLHWTKKKVFKDNLRWNVKAATNKKLKGGYHLDFFFTFKGRRLDTINTVHYMKVIEDALFKEDKDNRQICVDVQKGKENVCVLVLTKVETK